MRALTTAPGSTAIVVDIPVPEPGLKEIRVKVHSVALNPVDALYTVHQTDKPGRVVGTDIAGTVDKVGERVTVWKVGDRIAGLLQGATSANLRPGGFAEFAILEDDLAFHIPNAVSFDEAAAMPLCSLTAAQALFIRLDLNAPFQSPFKFEAPNTDSPAVLVYSAATSIGLYCIELLKLLCTPTGKPFRIFGTASERQHEKLLQAGLEAVFDYRSATWPEDIRKASGGISYAFDCISEDETTARISQTYGDAGGKIAVVRKSAWNKEGIRPGVTPLYGAAWVGLGHEILYNEETLPANPDWREFTVTFFKFLSSGSSENPNRFPISPSPIRLMPGGLDNIVADGFSLLGSSKVSDRADGKEHDSRTYMKPISGEKLVYRLA